MKKKQSITYLKDKKERTIILTKFNHKLIFKDLFEEVNVGEYKVKKEIKFIKFKNVVLNMKCLTCSQETICILEDCIINPHQTEKLILSGKNPYQIINTSLKKIDAKAIEDLEINNEKLTEEGEEIALTTKKVKLKGTYKLQFFKLRANKMIIGSPNEITQIIIDDTLKYNRVIEANQLELNNCLIINNSPSSNLYIDVNEITGQNFALKSKSNIILTNKNNQKQIKFSQKDQDGYVTIRIETIPKQDIISILKAYKKKINEIIAQQVNESQSANTQTKVTAQENLAPTKYELFCQERKRKNELIKKLQKKPIKHLN